MACGPPQRGLGVSRNRSRVRAGPRCHLDLGRQVLARKAYPAAVEELGVHATLDTHQRVLAVIAFLDAR